ncbi:hypothetical protein V6Z12_D12G095900 [Gossypium hirsutum]|uniref:Retrovirus-related Pol polyprotein from transposon TNT 1-94-like beta-barrel domain-containing protein n=1 Tax=Gossypium hirsutum TaxID=3635 RepID=A0A1U8MXR2_GOSHI|nr:uncharacterized protein LOC107942435 [Gossypium hirsutum]
MKCSADAALLKRFVEKNQIYGFFAGLNVEFDAVRVQILGKEELPSLNETIAIFHAEEGRRGVMIENSQVDSSASATKAVHERRFGLEQPTSKDSRQTELTRPIKSESLWCTYCKKSSHAKEKCWKLYGKPQTIKKNSKTGGQPKEQGRPHRARQLDREKNSQESPVAFNKDEIEKLKNLLGTLEKFSSIGTCSLDFSGISFSQDSKVSDTVTNRSWVVDSGAIDHMTHSSQKFVSYTPCPSNRKITVVEGSVITVTG